MPRIPTHPFPSKPLSRPHAVPLKVVRGHDPAPCRPRPRPQHAADGAKTEPPRVPYFPRAMRRGLPVVLALVLVAALGCGRDRARIADAAGGASEPEATPAASAAQAAQAAQAADGGAQAPGTAAESTAQDESVAATDDLAAPGGGSGTVTGAVPPEQAAQRSAQAERAEQERQALARKQKELAAREARVAAREAALQAPPPAPAAGEAEAPSMSDDGRPSDGGATDAAGSSDDDWRRSSYRTDAAARDGYDPAPPAADTGDWQEDEPAPEPAVTWTSELLPSGTRFTVELLDTVASDRNRPGDTFRARVSEDLTRGGEVVVPAGSIVTGRVTEAVPLDRKVGGRARLGLEFYELQPPGAEAAPIDADFAAKGKSETAKDAATIGGAAAAGAILGRVLNRGDKGKGSVIGAIVGAAAGTAIASHTEGEEVTLPEGAKVELVLTQAAQVPVRNP